MHLFYGVISTLLVFTANINSVSQVDELICLAIICNFEQVNLCNYQNVESNEVTSKGAWRKFEAHTKSHKNLATGVRQPGEGLAFASVYLYGGDKAIIESQGQLKADGIRYVFPLTADRIISFKVYKVADKMELKGCCDTITNCPYSTEKDVKITDFNKWKTASFTCKAGTQKVLFYGSNDGKNEGSIGIDDVQLLRPANITSGASERNACIKSDTETETSTVNPNVDTTNSWRVPNPNGPNKQIDPNGSGISGSSNTATTPSNIWVIQMPDGSSQTIQPNNRNSGLSGGSSGSSGNSGANGSNGNSGGNGSNGNSGTDISNSGSETSGVGNGGSSTDSGGSANSGSSVDNSDKKNTETGSLGGHSIISFSFADNPNSGISNGTEHSH